MEALTTAHASLEKKGNLAKAIGDVQTLIDQLQTTRDSIADSPELTALHMAKLKQPVTASFTAIEEDLKEVNKGLNQYNKALKDKFKAAQLPGEGGGGPLEKDTGLIDRAIAMHLLREGQFAVAETFVREANEKFSDHCMEEDGEGRVAMAMEPWMRDFGSTEIVQQHDFRRMELGKQLQGQWLAERFREMYGILGALRGGKDLEPAIAWAREHRIELERRGSNLEFELARLKFVQLYTSSSISRDRDEMDEGNNNTTTSSSSNNDANESYTGPLAALTYARSTFPTFSNRYAREISHLLGSLAYSPSLSSSPYNPLFHNSTNSTTVSATFTTEFCTLLHLPSTSPLYTAITAGTISLPVLQKVERVMAASRGQWTSVNELPVETPLPSSIGGGGGGGWPFHSIFVCPVSKEQATDANPPVMLPCGHVIARESLEGHARGKVRVKCPYCPVECGVREGRRVYI